MRVKAMAAVKSPAWMSFQGQCSGLHNPKRPVFATACDCAEEETEWNSHRCLGWVWRYSMSWRALQCSFCRRSFSSCHRRKTSCQSWLQKCYFYQKILDVGNKRRSSSRRDSEEIQSAWVYIALATKLRPPALAIGSRQHAWMSFDHRRESELHPLFIMAVLWKCFIRFFCLWHAYHRE